MYYFSSVFFIALRVCAIVIRGRRAILFMFLVTARRTRCESTLVLQPRAFANTPGLFCRSISFFFFLWLFVSLSYSTIFRFEPFFTLSDSFPFSSFPSLFWRPFSFLVFRENQKIKQSRSTKFKKIKFNSISTIFDYF